MDRPEQGRTELVPSTPAWCWAVVIGAAVLGLGLMTHAAFLSSATYDEVAYLRIAADWWRTGRSAEMTRMGSPVTFFKLQAAPVFFVLDQVGLGRLLDDPLGNQARLLPILRVGSLWIWLVALSLSVGWSRKIYGPRAMATAAGLFALSPNLLAHGGLATMEMPLVATSTAMILLFWKFLEGKHRRDFVLSAAVGGLAFSCKFTTVLIPPILGLLWLIDGLPGARWVARHARVVAGGMVVYGLILIVANMAVTGFAVLPLSPRTGDHPTVPRALRWLVEARWPQDWVGFLTQASHQSHGGPSYLLGERRMTGWWYYYPVALAVKVPIACWVLLFARTILAVRERSTRRDWLFPVAMLVFLAAAMVGSKRNYGVRYLLPLAPLAVVWISRLAEARGAWRWTLGLGLIGQAVAVALIHPYELSYFNALGGGPIGGRHILADSNLDWGQGLRSLARLERERFPSLTLYYFGDTEPSHYGLSCRSYVITGNRVPSDLPPEFKVETRYVAVSASLQYGPWGPEGYFRRLNALKPVAYTDDATIAIHDLGKPPR